MSERRLAPNLDHRRGSGSKPGTHSACLVFVHGAMDRASTWDRVRRRLTDVDTVAYDRRGYASSNDLPFSDDAFADHVADLLEVVEQSRKKSPGLPVVLVGHSAGSNVALAVAERDPTIAAAVIFEPPMSWLDWWPLTAGGSTLAVHASHGPEAAAESFMRRIVGDAVWERLPESTRQARRSEGLALVADLSTLRGRPVQFNHASIRVPVVVGCGELSLDHHRRGAFCTADALPSAELVELAGQRHGAHAGDPGGFVGMIHLAMAQAGLA